MKLINSVLAASLLVGASAAVAADPEYNMVIKLDDDTEVVLPTSRVRSVTFAQADAPVEVFNILTPTYIPDEALRTYIQQEIAQGASEFTNIDASVYDDPIDLQNSEVRNLEGLEFFTSVTDVTFANNDYLTTANFTALKNLKKLDISYCWKLTELRLDGLKKLESIDISSTALKSFRLNSLPATMRVIKCDNMNYPALDPKLFPVLEELQASQCNFQSIDFSGHNTLRIAYISGNALTSAKFANCRMLEQVALSYNTELESLDLSGVPNLKGLFIHNTRLNGYDFWQFRNTLEELNIAGLQGYDFHVMDMPKLTYLECQSCWLDGELTVTSPLLKVLRCEENQLTKVDVSACDSLTSLHAYSMPTMTELKLPQDQSKVENFYFKGMPLLTTLNITNINNIQYFTVSGCGVTTLDLSQGNPDGTYGLRYNPNLGEVKVWPDFDADAMGERWSIYDCPNMTVVK